MYTIWYYDICIIESSCIFCYLYCLHRIWGASFVLYQDAKYYSHVAIPWWSIRHEACIPRKKKARLAHNIKDSRLQRCSKLHMKVYCFSGLLTVILWRDVLEIFHDYKNREKAVKKALICNRSSKFREPLSTGIKKQMKMCCRTLYHNSLQPKVLAKKAILNMSEKSWCVRTHLY